MKKLSLLGSTGSIGVQSTEVVRMLEKTGAEADKYQIVGLAAHSNIKVLEDQIREFKPQAVAVFDVEAAKTLRAKVRELDVKVLEGM